MADIAGVSTLGVTFSYGTGTSKPASVSQLTRINAIGGVELTTEQIDASALEDLVSKYIAGRADTGGSISVTVNLTDATEKEWEDLISAYNAMTGTEQMYFQTSSPYLTKSFWMIAQPPQSIPAPEMSQNGLLTVEIPLTIVDYLGLEAKVAI